MDNHSKAKQNNNAEYLHDVCSDQKEYGPANAAGHLVEA